MSTTASTIQGRMLCAAGLAYSLPHATDGLVVGTMAPGQLTAPFFGGAGYAAAPTTIQNGLAACTIGSNNDGIVIAFRGTEFDSLFNWLDNAAMEYTTQAGIPGFIHHGFNTYLTKIIAQVADNLKSLLAATPSAQVFLTGHSAGAGMAPIAAYRLAQDYGIAATALYLMAPPSPGDKTFADAYNQKFPASFSYENGEDIVPMLPLSAPNALLFLAQAKSESLRHVLEVMVGLDYHRVGTNDNIFLLNFPKKGDQQQMHLLDDLTQWGLVEAILLAGNFMDKEIGSVGGLLAALFLDFDRFATAHSHGCGHGYMHALCPEISCP